MSDPTPITKFLGARGYPTLELARARAERRKKRQAIADALNALRPQPPAGIVLRLVEEASEKDSPEIVVGKAKELGFGS